MSCECGSILKTSWNALKSSIDYHDGQAICQKIKPYGEYLVKNYLKENGYKFNTQYSFKDLRDKNVLQFDFAIFDNNELLYLIEHDGRYHNNDYRNDHEYTKSHDKMKTNYCKENNIPLLRINNYKNIEQQIKSFEDEI